MLGTTFRFLIMVLTVIAVAYALSLYSPPGFDDDTETQTAQIKSS